MGKPTRISLANREEWLAARKRQGLGASEAASVAGCGFISRMDLWREKTGRAKPKDLSDNAAVQEGVRMEGPVREFFKAMHPDYTVEHHPFDILYQEVRPWMFATLDGEITREKATGIRHQASGETDSSTLVGMTKETDSSAALGMTEKALKERGILEIKNVTPVGKAGWDEWNGRIPDKYYYQILHQLEATGYDFAILVVALKGLDGSITIREYEFAAIGCAEDMDFYLNMAELFWGYVQRDQIPPLPIG